ncbi:NAD(+)/NADH kinase [Haloferacaceae archaeon DSL9]
MEVGIVAQKGNMRAAVLAGEIAERLTATGVSVRLDDATATALEAPGTGASVESFDECELVVSIGGDGTFLFAARGAGGRPIIGVNLGEVGFLNPIIPDNAVDAVAAEVESFRNGTLAVREAPRLAATCPETGWTSNPAVNELVVQGPRRGHGGGVDYTVRIDDSIYSQSHADGVLVSTPTGSTAYNLSEGGPLVHPSIGGLVVTEMCAEEGMPSLVVAGDVTVTLELSDAEYAVVASDGREPHELPVPSTVRIARTDPPVRIAGPTSDFFEALGKLS